jgi:manganese transport protein
VLLASGLASSGVGTYAGEIIMAGYLQRKIPGPVRRLATLAPALILLLCGISATDALVASQVILGFGVPFALGTLILVTNDRSLMGDLVNRRRTTVVATICASTILVVDAYSLVTVFH